MSLANHPNNMPSADMQVFAQHLTMKYSIQWHNRQHVCQRHLQEPQLLPRVTPGVNTFPCIRKSGLPSLSTLPLDPLICSQGLNNAMNADYPNLSSDEPSAPAIGIRERTQKRQAVPCPSTPLRECPSHMPTYSSLYSQLETRYTVKSFLHLLLPHRENWPLLSINVHVISECNYLTCPLHQVIGSFKARIWSGKDILNKTQNTDYK